MTTHDWVTSGMVVIVGVLSFLIKRQFDTYDGYHRQHFDHMNDFELHESPRDRESARRERQSIADELIRHADRDDQRFDAFDRKLDTIGNDIKALLRAAGKA